MKNLIKSLIEKKKEGSWWDFKREHHENPIDLLHDILCLSNTIHDGKRYLVIGVSNKYELVDVNDGKLRRTQANILDFLKTKKFSGDNIPNVSLDTVVIEGKEIDLITIENELKKPYYLLFDEKKGKKLLRSGVVYSRVGDTNTPIDKCANPNDVELMWRERFRLDLKSTEKFKSILLDYENWQYDGIDKAFYNLDSDYSIEIGSKEEKGGKFWWQNIFFEEPYSYYYHLKYKNSDIHKIKVVRFMNENLCIPHPSVEFITYPEAEDGLDVDFYCDLFYFRKDSIEYSLFYHMRSIEVSEVTHNTYETPIKNQIKPALIYLPFVILDDEEDFEELCRNIREKFSIFIESKNSKDECVNGERNILECERFFSEWVLKIAK